MKESNTDTISKITLHMQVIQHCLRKKLVKSRIFLLKPMKSITHNKKVICILKALFIKTTASAQPCDCSMVLFKNARKVVTPIRNVCRLDLSLDIYFHQTGSISSEPISLIGLTTGNNSSSRNVSYSTPTITRLIAYNYKKRNPRT